MTNHLRLRALCEGAVMVALATGLSFLKLFELPQGGSICIGMLPILLYSVRWGWKQGVPCGLVYGLLQLIFDGAYAWSWQSMLLDYLLAFALLGTAGFFRGRKYGIFVGSVVGCLLRFAAHFVAGITIWRIYAPTELFSTTFTNPYLYSALYNGSFVLIDLLLCLAIFAAVYVPLRERILGLDLRPAADA